MARTRETDGSAPRSGSRASLGRGDWVHAALGAITRGGLAAVSVERLAKELGATKGSFYWHFEDRADLVRGALAAWEERDTDAVIAATASIDDPRARLRSLFRLVFDDDARVQIDMALLADADDPVVASSLERVATKRLAHIDELFQAMGSEAASDRAVFAYTAFVGLAHLRRTADGLAPRGRRSSAYIDTITTLLLE